MSNLTALPPPQQSSDGRWRWDGQQWVPVKPTSSKQSALPGPGAPQLSSDGHGWWNGYEWAPAKQASPERPKPHGPGVLASIAAGLGLIALITPPYLIFAIMQPPPGTSYSWGDVFAMLAAPLSAAVLAVVLGVLALVFPGHGHDRSLRRRVAGGGIAASLVGATLALVFLFSSTGVVYGPGP